MAVMIHAVYPPLLCESNHAIFLAELGFTPHYIHLALHGIVLRQPNRMLRLRLCCHRVDHIRSVRAWDLIHPLEYRRC